MSKLEITITVKDIATGKAQTATVKVPYASGLASQVAGVLRECEMIEKNREKGNDNNERISHERHAK